ncbi:PIN-like domain-containing protein [Streptomyces sp. CA-251251]|uniref:PIN-like domain-containing protein n=1 Tax=Streptomyces sp. CA-251251 TaxID=3240063 RepID=UPI003D8F3A8D
MRLTIPGERFHGSSAHHVRSAAGPGCLRLRRGPSQSTPFRLRTDLRFRSGRARHQCAAQPLPLEREHPPDTLAALARLRERLWIPHQVLTEFWRNRESPTVRHHHATKANEASAALDKAVNAARTAVTTWLTAVQLKDNDEAVERTERRSGRARRSSRQPQEVHPGAGRVRRTQGDCHHSH